MSIDRKVWAGGLAGVVTWALMLGLGAVGYPVPVEMQPLLVSLMGSAIGFLTPPSMHDIIKRLDNAAVQMAADDPAIPVTLQTTGGSNGPSTNSPSR